MMTLLCCWKLRKKLIRSRVNFSAWVDAEWSYTAQRPFTQHFAASAAALTQLYVPAVCSGAAGWLTLIMSLIFTCFIQLRSVKQLTGCIWRCVSVRCAELGFTSGLRACSAVMALCFLLLWGEFLSEAEIQRLVPSLEFTFTLYLHVVTFSFFHTLLSSLIWSLCAAGAEMNSSALTLMLRQAKHFLHIKASTIKQLLYV